MSDQRSNPEEASPPLLSQEQILEIRRGEDPELLKGLAMLPTLPSEIKDELFSLYLSSWHEFVYGESNSMRYLPRSGAPGAAAGYSTSPPAPVASRMGSVASPATPAANTAHASTAAPAVGGLPWKRQA